MSEPDTPDTASVRLAYVDRRDFIAQVTRTERQEDSVYEAEFDRWLAGIRADAFDEGAEAQMDADENGHDAPDNPYEEAAWSTPMGADHER